MTRAERQQQGLQAERFFYGWAKDQGLEVIWSAKTDEYDQEKDMLVDGVSVEIKSSVPYCQCPVSTGKEPCATVLIEDYIKRDSQLRKCLTVPRLIFVLRPIKLYREVLQIAEVPKPRRFEEITVHGRKELAFKISEMKILWETTKPSQIEMYLNGK